MNLYLRLVLLGLTSHRRPRIDLWDTATLGFRVLPTDLDVLRHMNNGRYLTIMDLGRVDLMQRCGLWGPMKRRGWYPVMAGASITYRRSLNPGQRFDLDTRILGFHDRWVYVEQVFRVGDVVHARAIARALFLKRSGGAVGRDELEDLAGVVPQGREVPSWVVEWTEHASVTAP